MRSFSVLRRSLMAGAVLAAALATAAVVTPADARVFVRFGLGVPYFGPYPYYPYYPYYPPAYYPPYYPSPVVVTQPVATAPAPAAAQTWYYCDNPRGYYPYVQSCGAGWRQVPAAPGGPTQ